MARSAGLLRAKNDAAAGRVAFVFCGLIFVFAITQLPHLLRHASHAARRARDGGPAPRGVVALHDLGDESRSWSQCRSGPAPGGLPDGEVAMAAEAAAQGPDIASVVVLLAAGVVAVPLFRRLGLGSVLGYLAAGIVIGPFGLGLFSDTETILHVAELGVVLFLFVIGLEMQPSRLWAMRGEIFGLGVAQVAVCILLLWTVGLSLGYPLAPSLIAGAGFVLTSTAIVMQMLEERGTIDPAARTADHRHPAARGSRDRAASRARRLPRARRRDDDPRPSARRGGDRPRGDRGAGRGGALAAQSRSSASSPCRGRAR